MKRKESYELKMYKLLYLARGMAIDGIFNSLNEE